MGKTAIVIGATGLIGGELLRLLLEEKEFSTVKVFVRRSFQIAHPKLIEQAVNFEHIQDHASDVTGDVIFCCIGTTINKAGSREKFMKVDHDLPLEFGTIARNNGMKKFILVSSLGADPGSSNFYLKVKGQTEADLRKLGFESFFALRPSMLLGKRNEFRLGESIGKVLMKSLSFIFFGPLKKYKAIEAKVVAEAMLRLSVSDDKGFRVLESDEIQAIGH